MPATSNIPKKRTDDASCDYKQLYELGLKHVQRLASRIWTDYNVHDPGITTLELLCYALTDLSYRASLPMEDLLAGRDSTAEDLRKQFFTARQILPNRPLTLLDYRKLLIDLPGVKNAWLRPAARTYYADTVQGELLLKDTGLPGIKEVHIAGLYRVTIEYMDDTTASQKKGINKAVMERLQNNRALCEDFAGIDEVEPQFFSLCAEVEIAPAADTAKAKAEILFQVQRYLAPPVGNYTLSEILERTKADGTQYSTDEIFDGPLLDCGFIDTEELKEADLRKEIRLSDVISIIMDIEGVQAVRDIVINRSPENEGELPSPPDNAWVVPVDAGKKAVLDKTRLVFSKRSMPVVPDEARVDEHLAAMRKGVRDKAETAVAYDFAVPQGKYREPDNYYAFQNHFPAVYGLSEAGLSSMASEKQRALSYQLKAYLIFFDQLMANYCAQLSHVRDLFSHDPEIERTYFYQLVDSFVDYAKIYKITGSSTGEMHDALAGLMENFDGKEVSIERRNRFLDHLIARFAERFNDFANIMYSSFNIGPSRMIPYKCDFLSTYPAVSSERALAYNCTLKNETDLWNSENVSGLEKRLAKLLGFNHQRRNLGDIAYDIYAEVDKTPDDEFRFRIRKKDAGKIILSSSTKYAAPEQARAEMARAIRFGKLPSGFSRKMTSDGNHYFNVIDDTGEVIARRIEYFKTAEEMNAAIDELMEYLRVQYSDEGMYLIENILLLPEVKDDPLLPICPAANKSSCADEDPYSFRIHIILPAYGSRFQDMDFRRFAEQVIREETPAHILPKICWICREDMAILEKAYQDWIYLKSGKEKAQRRDKLTEFINMLFSVKNVYPSRYLYECGSDESRKKFQLGQTALGTMSDSER